MAKINVRDRNKNKPDKKPNWEYRFEAARIGEKRKHISKAGFKTKKEALEAGASALSEYNEAGQLFKPSEISVSDYMDYWYKNYCVANLKYNTLLTYYSLITSSVKPSLGVYKLRSLSPSIMQEYVTSLNNRGYATSTILTLNSILKEALSYAVFPLKYIRENPMSYVKIPTIRKTKKTREVITREEFEKILQHYPFGNKIHIPLLFGWYCGLRVSETIALTWEDIDFEKKTLSVNKQVIRRNHDDNDRFATENRKIDTLHELYFAAPKYDSNRTIKIGDSLLDALKREKQRQESNKENYKGCYTAYVSTEETDEKGRIITGIVPIKSSEATALPYINLICVDENGVITKRNVIDSAARIVRKAIDKPFDYHSLRHSHATLLIENGVSAKAVQQRLGHRNIVTTLQTYVKATENMQQQAADAFEDYMAAPLNEKGEESN